MTLVKEAVEAGRLAGCLWMYSNYHCNLTCDYCLTESSPRAPRRLLDSEQMLALAREAAELGFQRVGVGGGEPFLVADMPERLAKLARVLPVVVLTNGTLFNDRVLERLRPLAELPVEFQVSLDSANPEINDRVRGEGNFKIVVETIPRLVELGLKVRMATTGAEEDPEKRAALCALHRGLGIAEQDHIVRPVVHRGRAVDAGVGAEATVDSLPPELTVTADGAFWSPFAPTVHGGCLDTDLLISRTFEPLSKPAEIMLGLVEGRPPGSDATLEIR